MTLNDFAKTLGYESYNALLAASIDVTPGHQGEVSWYITPLHDGGWLAWDDGGDLNPDRFRTFATEGEARQFQAQKAG